MKNLVSVGQSNEWSDPNPLAQGDALAQCPQPRTKSRGFPKAGPGLNILRKHQKIQQSR